MSSDGGFVVNEHGGAVSKEPDEYTRKDPAILTSRPDHIRRHDISDEELDMLCESRSDHVWEILLLALGGGISTTPVAIGTMFRYFRAAFAESDALQNTARIPPITFTDVVQLILFWACVSVAVSLGIVNWARRKRSTDLRDVIRARNNHR